MHYSQTQRSSRTPLRVFLTCVVVMKAAKSATARPTVVPLDDGGGGGSTTGIIIGCVVAIAGVLFIAGLVAFICILRNRRRLYRRQAAAYADADSIAFQDDHSHHLNQRNLNNGQQRREGTETEGIYSHHTVETNEPVTPPQNPTTPQMRDRRDNYADRFDSRNLHRMRNRNGDGGEREGEEDEDEEEEMVRPASPTADRVEGVAIENRVRPRRNLPRGQVIVHHDNQDVCLDFRGVERVPQAGPPPLTAEEKQRLIDAQNRVASPEFYGRAEYEHRRASNNNTPNVLLSSSLLRELQQQYAAASASGQVFPSYASDATHSIGSMSFRPGSPAGSVRRNRRDGRQSTSPTSVSIGGQQLRNRKANSRQQGNHNNSSRDASGAHQYSSAQRHYRDDLESTSDDFEDLSLHNDSFNLRGGRPQHVSGLPMMPGMATSAGGMSFGFDQMSLRSNSPGAFERYMSAPGSVHGMGNPNTSIASGLGVSSPPDRVQEPPAALAHSSGTGPHSTQSTTTITSPVTWGNEVRSPPYPNNSKFPSFGKGKAKNATVTPNSNGLPPSPQSWTASPEMLPNLVPGVSPPSPSHPIINFIGAATATGGRTPPHLGRGNSNSSSPMRPDGLPPAIASSRSGSRAEDASRGVVPAVFLKAASGKAEVVDDAAPLPRPRRKDEKATPDSRNLSTHSKSD